MKIAICLYGKFTGVNNRGDIQGFEIPFEFLKKNIITDGVDIFLHGWDDNESESNKLINLVNPKKYILEKQVQFNHPYTHYDFVPNGPWNTKDYLFNNYSRFYSLKKCLELVDDSYDLILITRFDTVFYEPIPFELLSPDNFYVTNWEINKDGWGFNDAWFISGTKIMKEYSLLFDKLNNYFNLNSGDYINYLKKYGLDETNLTSGHALYRYRCVEMGITDQIYSIGLEYKTWGLLRRLDQKINMVNYSGPDINIPNKL
jgi:hypothetical protein